MMSTLQADVLVGQRLLQHRHKGHLVSKLLVLIHDIVGVCTGLDKGRGGHGQEREVRDPVRKKKNRSPGGGDRERGEGDGPKAIFF